MTPTPRNFLLTTWEGGGSVAPVLTVAKQLAGRGHRVRVMSDRCNRFEVEASGAAFIPWTRAPSRPNRLRETDISREWEVPTPQEGLRRVFDRIMVGPALAYAEDLIEQLALEPVDLVIANEMLFGVPMACEAVGQPHVLLTCNVSLFPIPGVPPLGPGLLPAVTGEDRALHAEIAAANEAMLNSALPGLNAARASLGLAPLDRLMAQHDAAERLLLGTARCFDFAPEALPDHVRYVGPLIGEPAWAAPWDSPWEAEDPRPLVLVAFSTTFQDHVGPLQRVVDALGTLPVRGLVTLGDTIAPEELVAPANVRLVHSAPHDRVMSEAALVITHGGHGTVSRALFHRLPLLVLPHGRDQNDNAVRVTARGAGLALPTDASSADIAAALGWLMTEESFVRNAAALGLAIADEIARSTLVAELEALANRPTGFASLSAAAA